jgi:hypothetical protein
MAASGREEIRLPRIPDVAAHAANDSRRPNTGPAHLHTDEGTTIWVSPARAWDSPPIGG